MPQDHAVATICLFLFTFGPLIAFILIFRRFFGTRCGFLRVAAFFSMVFAALALFFSFPLDLSSSSTAGLIIIFLPVWTVLISTAIFLWVIALGLFYDRFFGGKKVGALLLAISAIYFILSTLGVIYGCLVAYYGSILERTRDPSIIEEIAGSPIVSMSSLLKVHLIYNPASPPSALIRYLDDLASYNVARATKHPNFPLEGLDEVIRLHDDPRALMDLVHDPRLSPEQLWSLARKVPTVRGNKLYMIPSRSDATVRLDYDRHIYAGIIEHPSAPPELLDFLSQVVRSDAAVAGLIKLPSSTCRQLKNLAARMNELKSVRIETKQLLHQRLGSSCP